jgi:type IV pilus assembly protein PilB
MAQSRRVLPLYKRNNKLYVAISDPANLQVLDEVRFKTNLVPEPIVVEDDKLIKAIAKLAESTQSAFNEKAGSLDDIEDGLNDDNAPQAFADEDTSDIDDAPVVKYIQKLLLDAISQGASDIHFEPYEKFFRVRYRIDGVLSEVVAAAAGHQGQGGFADQGDQPARHLGEARAAGRPHEAGLRKTARSTSGCPRCRRSTAKRS